MRFGALLLIFCLSCSSNTTQAGNIRVESCFGNYCTSIVRNAKDITVIVASDTRFLPKSTNNQKSSPKIQDINDGTSLKTSISTGPMVQVQTHTLGNGHSAVSQSTITSSMPMSQVQPPQFTTNLNGHSSFQYQNPYQQVEVFAYPLRQGFSNFWYGL